MHTTYKKNNNGLMNRFRFANQLPAFRRDVTGRPLWFVAAAIVSLALWWGALNLL